MAIRIFSIAFLFSLISCASLAQNNTFKVVPLGVKGGLDESNLSSYMVAVNGTEDYICLDAGTLYSGINKAIENKLFINKKATDILKQNIKGYCISHAHLDHLSGLVINSPDDTAKNIYAMDFCLDVLKNNYFTWKSWANFTDAGEKPLLNKYHYVSLQELQEVPLTGTNMFVTAFMLSHSSPYQSTAFLVRHNDDYILYLGDTGADTIEHSNKLELLWKQVAPLVKVKKLKAIFIEVSYSNAQPVTKLFGHLTPSLLIKEMNVLADLAGKENIKELNVAVTHIKPAADVEATIQKELQQSNQLQIHFVFPEQGKELLF